MPVRLPTKDGRRRHAPAFSLATLALAMWFGCSASTGPGLDDGADGQDGGESGDASDGPEPGDLGPFPDFDPNREFLLRVQPGFGLCATFSTERSWQEQFDWEGRIALRPGDHRLPLEDWTAPSQLLGDIHFGRNAAMLEPLSAEFVTVSHYQGYYRTYTFSRRYRGGTADRTVLVSLTIEPDDGGVWPTRLILDPSAAHRLLEGLLREGDTPDWRDSGSFSTCPALGQEPEQRIHVEAANEDRFILDLYPCTYCLCGGRTSCRDLGRARAEIGGQRLEVEDPLRLVYTAVHHNWEQRFLIFLPVPAGQVHAVLLAEGDFWQPETGLILYLDEGLETIEQAAISGWTVEMP